MNPLKLILAALLACASLVPTAEIRGYTSTTILNGQSITFDAAPMITMKTAVISTGVGGT